MTAPKICGFMSSISHSHHDNAFGVGRHRSASPISTRSTFGVSEGSRSPAP